MVEKKQIMTWSIAALLLVGVWGEQKAFHPPPADPSAYHARVRAAGALAPLQFGNWVGQDGEVAAGAITLLKPNIILQRLYRNKVTGQTARVLVVHCSDAGDMLGHYPPVCYPSSGFREVQRTSKHWEIGGEKFNGYEYDFTSNVPGQLQPVVVDDFMLLPTGQSVGDMDTVRHWAKNRRVRQYGAGQMQVLTDPTVSPTVRAEIFKEMVTAYLPLLTTMREAVAHDQ